MAGGIRAGGKTIVRGFAEEIIIKIRAPSSREISQTAMATETSALATGLSASSTTTPASAAGGVSTSFIFPSVSPAELNG